MIGIYENDDEWVHGYMYQYAGVCVIYKSIFLKWILQAKERDTSVWNLT